MITFPSDPHFIVTIDGFSRRLYATEQSLRAHLVNTSIPAGVEFRIARDLGCGPRDVTAQFAVYQAPRDALGAEIDAYFEGVDEMHAEELASL